jgi:predicted enzyme related to lactoylglutathione lyase
MSKVIHFEVHAQDPQRAMEFYRHVLGWEFQNWNDQPYWLITAGPKEEPGIDGALLPRQGMVDGGAVIAYVCTVNVLSVDDVAAAVEAHGGILAQPKAPIPGSAGSPTSKTPRGTSSARSSPM